MSFVDFGISIMKNNMRLRSRYRLRYERNKGTSYYAKKRQIKSKLPHVYPKYSPGHISNKGIRIIIQVVVVLLTSFYASRIINSYILESHSIYEENLEELRRQELRKTYVQLIKNGNIYLKTEQYSDAQWEFYQAVNLFTSGSDANHGLTKALLYQCKLNNVFCLEARQYTQMINKSEKYSDVQKQELFKINNNLDNSTSNTPYPL